MDIYTLNEWQLKMKNLEMSKVYIGYVLVKNAVEVMLLSEETISEMAIQLVVGVFRVKMKALLLKC